MANFKVGDTVEIVEENDNSSVNKKGDIGIVLEINEYPNGISTLYRVEVENRGRSCNWETEEDLKLVKVMEKFKVGDKVEVTDGTANSNEVGDIGIITEMDIDNTYRVTVKGNSNSGNWMYPSMFKLVESPVNTTKYVEVSGKDLVIGRTYYTRSNGSDKAIYEW
jgi:ribosomal protein L21E